LFEIKHHFATPLRSHNGRCMAAFEHAMLRLAAVRNVMNSIRGGENFLVHVRQHVKTLRAIFRDRFFIRELKEDSDKTTQATTAIIDLGLPGDVEADLLGNLLDTVNADGQRHNQQLQDYIAAPKYLSPDMWESIGEGGVKAALVYMFIEFLMSIGLWCPSETTYQMLTLSFLIAWQGEVVVDAMDFDTKRGELDYMKRAYKQQVITRGDLGDDAPVFVSRLPEDPQQFIHDYPSLATPLLNNPPGGAPLDFGRLKVMAAQIKMRARKPRAPVPGEEMMQVGMPGMPMGMPGMHWGGVLI
jgi:hypothetical protein